MVDLHRPVYLVLTYRIPGCFRRLLLSFKDNFCCKAHQSETSTRLTSRLFSGSFAIRSYSVSTDRRPSDLNGELLFLVQ